MKMHLYLLIDGNKMKVKASHTIVVEKKDWEKANSH